jgi:hypothetical protein
MSERALTTIPFRGATLAAIAGPTPETTHVALRPLVDGMGLDWSGQLQRIKRHPVLRTCVVVMTTQLPGDTQAREAVFLALPRVHFFLGTIQPDRVKDPAARAAVIAFQEEVADVLFAHFFGKAAAAAQMRAEPEDPGLMEPDDIRLKKVNTAIRAFGPRAGAQLWVKLGLDWVPAMGAILAQPDIFDSATPPGAAGQN